MIRDRRSSTVDREKKIFAREICYIMFDESERARERECERERKLAIRTKRTRCEALAIWEPIDRLAEVVRTGHVCRARDIIVKSLSYIDRSL